ncbi:hypothetical protein ACFL6P_06480 [Candidatus Latescibacterota bacterium]
MNERDRRRLEEMDPRYNTLLPNAWNERKRELNALDEDSVEGEERRMKYSREHNPLLP